ncbi:MAG: trypsin-like serine protease [Clostridiales bacterium]|nr:trypsin-like serine protease [Clostridiales bacterium]
MKEFWEAVKVDDFYNFKNEEPEYRGNHDYEAKTASLKRVNIALIVISAVLALALIANIIVLATLKDKIAESFMQGLNQSLKTQYQEAINKELKDKDIISDVVERAADGALNRLIMPIGEYVRDNCLKSVALITCTTPNYGTSKGTGFLISDSDNRYLLTNHHVVTYKYFNKTNPHSSIKCSFYDNPTQFTLKVVALDEGNDLALLTFSSDPPSPSSHKALSLASSDYMRLGEEVALIGNPAGIGFSITTGVISNEGIYASNWGDAKYIMTDAAVNPGNSGGPMINNNGVVVGVIVSKIASSDIDNMGFAIAISSVLEFLEWAKSPENNIPREPLDFTYTILNKA